jgi:hypothetical protein
MKNSRQSVGRILIGQNLEKPMRYQEMWGENVKKRAVGFSRVQR